MDRWMGKWMNGEGRLENIKWNLKNCGLYAAISQFYAPGKLTDSSPLSGDWSGCLMLFLSSK